jgi:UDP-N-acetylmuramyl pentapeptide phosphotransferase/UDP-N-acetylglucosamine-1-phosphate transferase
LIGYYLNLWIVRLDIPWLDWLLSFKILSILLTIIAIAGLSNAYNIIDGFNGLSSMIAIISLLAIGYVAFKVNDIILVTACLSIAGAIMGFFFWNYPKGFIFLGDCGAYLVGFLIASISILLVTRNPEISPWFCLLLNVYPIFETLFTIWRRGIYQGRNPGLPDGTHLHTLIFRRLLRWPQVPQKNNIWAINRNARTSPHLWVLSSFAVFPSLIWWDNTFILQCFVCLFCVLYVWAYRALVKFKIPKFLR